MIGIIKKIDFGSGGWKLVCSNGKEYELVGNVPPQFIGKRVQVIGTQEESFGFVMSGLPQLIIKQIVYAPTQ